MLQTGRHSAVKLDEPINHPCVKASCMTLTWEKANFGHRADLQRFSCVPPHGYPPPFWVDEVERFIHSQLPPVQAPNYLGLYFRDEVLAAVCAHQREDWTYWFIQVIAVAGHSSGCGAGRETLTLALDEISIRAAERNEPEVIVECLIHERNWASRRLFAWAGFRSKGPAQDEPGLELWRYELLTPALSDDWGELAW